MNKNVVIAIIIGCIIGFSTAVVYIEYSDRYGTLNVTVSQADDGTITDFEVILTSGDIMLSKLGPDDTNPNDKYIDLIWKTSWFPQSTVNVTVVSDSINEVFSETVVLGSRCYSYTSWNGLVIIISGF